MAASEKSDGSVGVISKVLRILEAIQTSPSGLTLKPICDLTGVHKSTAHRFLKHLQREGYLLRIDSGAYMIGPKLSQMAASASPQATLNAISRPALWDLWKATHETVNLAVLDHGTVLYVDVIESPHEFRLSARIGTRRALYATALGKSLGAFMQEEQREQVLNSIGFQPLTPHTIGNLLQFRRELAKVKQQGYAVDDEEAIVGVRCVSAPILGADGHAIAAISVSGPVTRIGAKEVPVLAEAAIRAAAAISEATGFSPRRLDVVRQAVEPVTRSHRRQRKQKALGH
jgi:IclR family acetate operon transcriptional repressor